MTLKQCLNSCKFLLTGEMNMSTFSIDRPFLQDLLRDIGSGRIQLPDFQRDWVWDDYRIRSLLASISQAFPIGSVLTLETGSTDFSFKARLIEGTDPVHAQNEPTTLILDGQQRLTALFQSVMSGKAVSIRNNRGNDSLRWYYIDMDQSVNSDINREETVISCGEDHKLQTPDGGTIDLSSVEEQYKNNMFPVHKIFDSASWRQGYYRHWERSKEKMDLFDNFEGEIITCFQRYNVPVIELRGAPREAVCMVFEKVNTGGITLTVFELLTASFAAKEFDLREDWNKRVKYFRKFPVLRKLDNISFLRALSLLVSGSCTRRDLLELDVQTYKQKVDKVQAGFAEAAKFLNRRKIFNSRDVPYQTQLVPLAAILAELGDEGMTIGAQEKITRWYWCGVLGEMYAGSIDSRVANDFSEVIGWIQGNSDEPATIQEANFQTNRVLELRTRGSAAYKGSYALLIAQGCHDFLMERTTEDMERSRDDIDIHHIFPRAWCKKEKIAKEIYDSIINKTPLSARANRKIGGRAPSKYLAKIQEDAGIDGAAMDEILTSHLICPSALRDNNFEKFFEDRKAALLDIIEEAMGKEIIREPVIFDIDALLNGPDAQN
ncbi:hypothetical protein C6503_24875 [Candidatus Poribacteria bacterium]|nr:MAG: hypothetical protein C6503_24875 [Candidatus Poribacteria bacterium]